MLTCWQIEKSVFVKIRLLEWATGDSLLVSRELFQLRIYHLAGDYFTLLTEEYGKYMGGPRVIAVGVILTISHLLEISECDYMLSALRRMELRGHLNEIYDGVIVTNGAIVIHTQRLKSDPGGNLLS